MKKYLSSPLLCLFFSLALFACTKTELIEGNVAPPDNTIESWVKRDYVNRLHISLLGREPSEAELNAALSTLNAASFSLDSRKSVINSIQEEDEYFIRLFEINRANLLNGVDTLTINDYIATFYNLYLQSQDSAEKEILLNETNKLIALRTVSEDLIAGTIDVPTMHQRCVNNFLFDELNMGTENFVVACFQHFLHRYPTQEELENSKTMVDGFEAILFQQLGSSKADFLDIFFHSAAYQEGLVRSQYLQYLFEEPEPYTSIQLAYNFAQTNNFLALQKEILATDDYAGIE